MIYLTYFAKFELFGNYSIKSKFCLTLLTKGTCMGVQFYRNKQVTLTDARADCDLDNGRDSLSGIGWLHMKTWFT